MRFGINTAKVMPENHETKGEIVIYKTESGPELAIQLQNDSFWLTQAQIASLFGTQRPAITKHLRNIFNTAELSQKAVCSILEHTASDGKTYKTQYYNLDAVIAVGYRVNSKRATQFRIWATGRLRDYLLKGFLVNQDRLKEQSQAKLKELEGATKLLQRAIASRRTIGLEKELLTVITEYAHTWTTLIQFDDNNFPKAAAGNMIWVPDYEKLREVVAQFKERIPRDSVVGENFGKEKGVSFKELITSITGLQPSVSETGAYLFYTVIKSEPFVDGNKQIATLLLLVYLVHNNLYYNRRGERKLDDATMIALSVLVEESSGQDKQIMIQLIASMINQK